jgi:serine protease Do
MGFGHLTDRQRFRRSPRSLLIGAAGAAALAFAAGAGAQTTAQTPAADGKNITQEVQNAPAVALPSLAPLVQRVSPAVVTISAQMTNEAQAQPSDFGSEGSSDQPSSSLDQMLRRFFENHGMPPQSGHEVMALGSGFIIDPSGYIVTNQHVVGTSDKITVVLQDNSKHQAKVIGRDEKTDLALLKIDAPDKLPFVAWGDSDKMKVGDWVVAVGNPFGLGGSVTAGIISALGRNIHEGPYDDFIQIDAPINRGNSGGPTFDLSGQIIGINTAIYSPSGGSVGIGFAIPSNVAKPIIAQLRESGHVVRGWLGVAIQSITPAIAKSLGLNADQPGGALVATVTPNSPAAKAGLKQGDVIVSANGEPIKNVNDLPRRVAMMQPGQKLELGVRRGGNDVKLATQVGEMPDKEQALANPNALEPQKQEPKTSSLGLELSSIDPAVRRHFQIPRDVDGVVVSRIAGDSPLAELGLEAGDVVQSIDQQPVTSPQQAAKLLKDASGKGNVLLLLNRHGSSQFVGLSIGQGPQGSGTSR